MSVSEAPQVRRLVALDEPTLTRCLHNDRGFGLFVTGNLLSYGFSGGVDYWGQYLPSLDAGLAAVLMIVGGSATIYAPASADVGPLARVAVREPLRFIMGRADLMTPVATLAGNRVERIEQHHFVDVTTQRFHRELAQPPRGVMVRRGKTSDVGALADLYADASGFEGLSPGQIRNIMLNRVTHLRTYLVVAGDNIVAAASTSAESYTAAMIGGVWAAPTARGKGYGTLAVAALSAELLRERMKPYLFYLVDNGPAEHIYTKIGFRVIGDWKVIYFAR
jgi:GNAT superfamily N-acetyltransferase